MREIRTSGSEGGARFNPLSLPLSDGWRFVRDIDIEYPAQGRGRTRPCQICRIRGG